MKAGNTHKSSWFASIAVILLILIFPPDFCTARENITSNSEAGIKRNANDLSGEKISLIKIHITKIKHNIQKWESTAKNLIPIKKQDAYNIKKIEQAVKQLVDSNLFASIHVPDPVQKPDGVEISFFLTPFARISLIDIKNAFPLFKQEVINAMTIYTGDVFSIKKLDKQAELVEKLFKTQGYIDPVVKVLSQKDKSDGNYNVSVNIDKREFYRVNSVAFSGNHSFSSSRLKLRTKIWKASLLFGSGNRFIKKEMDEDIKNLVDFYRKKGFSDISIKPEVKKNANLVDIIFHFNQGPEYDISFNGNENFWNYTLKKELAFTKHGNKNNYALKKSIRNLKTKYIKDGFLDISIEPQVIDNAPQNSLKRNIIFKINEGCQYQVANLNLHGIHSVSKETLLKNILSKPSSMGIGGIYTPQTLAEDIQAIKSVYLKQGFTKTRVKKKVEILDCQTKGKTGEKPVAIDLIINEGIQTKIDAIDFKGLTIMDTETALSFLALKQGENFNKLLLENDVNTLVENIAKKGHPHARVKAVTDFNADRSGVTLCYQINEGKKVKTGQVVYAGNLRTKKHILDNEMEIETGDPFSLTRLIESRKNMLDINALESTGFRTIGLKNNSDEVDIVVEVEEKKPYFFEAGTGYDTERHFFFTSILGDQNFWGRNLDLKSSAEISQIGYKADISLKEPKLFSHDISSSTRFFTEVREEFNKDFGTKTYGLSQNFDKSFFNEKLFTSLGFAYKYREQYLTGSRLLTEEEKEQLDPRHIIVTSPSLIYKTTKSFVRPKNGLASSFNMDISKGFENQLDDFVKFQLDARYYYTLFDPLTFAVHGRYGLIQPYGGNTRVPEDQLFFLGGTSTVRGFDENQLRFDASSGQAIGGREITLASLEARYDLGLNFELTLFYDIGSVEQTQGRSDSESFRDSVGLGLRYMTPIGPIGFLYGWKLDPEKNESSGNFHFSMGYTF